MFLRLFVLWKMYMLKVAIKIIMAPNLLTIFNTLRSNTVLWGSKIAYFKEDLKWKFNTWK